MPIPPVMKGLTVALPGMVRWQLMRSTLLSIYMSSTPGQSIGGQPTIKIPMPSMEQTYPPAPIAPLTVYPKTTSANLPILPAAVQIKELNDLFMWYWICLVGMILTAGLSGIASFILFFVIIYRCWQLIQDGKASTTPRKAIGYCFIPIYNLIWFFQAFADLAKDTNSFIRNHNLPIQPLDEDLSTAYCVLLVLNCIPGIDILTGIASFIISIIMLHQFKKKAVSIIQFTVR